MPAESRSELIARYEKLRADDMRLAARLRELMDEMERTDMELVEIERRLPDDYVHPDDQPDRHLFPDN